VSTAGARLEELGNGSDRKSRQRKRWLRLSAAAAMIAMAGGTIYGLRRGLANDKRLECLADAFRHQGKYLEAIQTQREFLRRNGSFYDPEGIAARLATILRLLCADGIDVR